MADQTYIEGRNALREALRAGRPIDKLYVLRGAEGLGALVAQAREAGAVVVECDRVQLDRLSQTHAHQGIIASVSAIAYAEVEDLLARAREAGVPPFLVACDGVEDPGNLGAIIRTAEAAGAHGVVIPKRRSASLTAQVEKASAGALAHLPVARVPGIPAFLREIKQQNIWVFGADAAGDSVFQTDFSGGICLVLGGEGQGLSQLTARECDRLVGIPMLGKVASLNVSCAAAVLMYAAVKARQGL